MLVMINMFVEKSKLPGSLIGQSHHVLQIFRCRHSYRKRGRRYVHVDSKDTGMPYFLHYSCVYVFLVHFVLYGWHNMHGLHQTTEFQPSLWRTVCVLSIDNSRHEGCPCIYRCAAVTVSVFLSQILF